MPINYSQLTSKQIVSNRQHVLDDSAVNSYIEAVDDQYSSVTNVPPMAIAALSLKGVIQDLEIPGGTLHVGQEITFKGAINIPQTLLSQASVIQNSLRGNQRFLVIGMLVTDEQGNEVMEARSTIMIPE
ncbi:MAG: hypothetical protein VX701_06285 [Chloroflexota bacterium]|nr:hypothetical protein [Chloroflexota bacterium]